MANILVKKFTYVTGLEDGSGDPTVSIYADGVFIKKVTYVKINFTQQTALNSEKSSAENFGVIDENLQNFYKLDPNPPSEPPLPLSKILIVKLKISNQNGSSYQKTNPIPKASLYIPKSNQTFDLKDESTPQNYFFSYSLPEKVPTQEDAEDALLGITSSTKLLNTLIKNGQSVYFRASIPNSDPLEELLYEEDFNNEGIAEIEYALSTNEYIDKPSSNTSLTSPPTTSPTIGPIYTYSDGTTITFENASMGKKHSIITYGVDFPDGSIKKGGKSFGQNSISSFDVLAGETIAAYNNQRIAAGVIGVTLVSSNQPKPPPTETTYNYTDNTAVVFKKLGPFNTAILYPGATAGYYSAGVAYEAEKTVSTNLELLANERIIGYNSARTTAGLPEVKFINIDVPPSNPPVSPTKYSIRGTIVDKLTVKPIAGAKISISQFNKVNTNADGEFNIVGQTSTNIKITISCEKYTSLDISPYYAAGGIKEDIGVIQLTLVEKNLEQDKIDSSLISDKETDDLIKRAKPKTPAIQKTLTKAIIKLKTILIPLILTLIAAFGIAQLAKLKSKGKTTPEDLKNLAKCPSPSELNNIIKKKNSYVKQINQLLKTIKSVEKAIKILQKIIDTTKKAITTIEIASMALPTSVPPGVGIPAGVINKTGALIKKFKDLILQNEGKLNSLADTLSLLKSSLAKALEDLKTLDTLVQHCYQENNNKNNNQDNNKNNNQDNNQDNNNQEQISAELIAITTDKSNQGSPIVTDVNGFTMGVETEPQISTLSVKRRRATATNKQGVVMLTGEWSFSSIDQILIDELVFYIQTNDLRAD